MKRFKNHQRVRVTDGELEGRFGTVWRLRHCDDAAWIAMDEDIPDSHRMFPADDDHGRGNHVILYPDQCEAASRPPRLKVVQ
jgi:hypothetical protein